MTKILIIDDSETLRIQLRSALEGDGYDVIEAIDGVDGLNKAKENPEVKLLIIDFNMPNMDGITMARKVKELPNFAKVPMMMLTTEISRDIKAAGREAGIIAWVGKPLMAESLLTAIHKILEKYALIQSN